MINLKNEIRMEREKTRNLKTNENTFLPINYYSNANNSIIDHSEISKLKNYDRENPFDKINSLNSMNNEIPNYHRNILGDITNLNNILK